MNSLNRTKLFIHENNEDNLETTENDSASFEEYFGTSDELRISWL